MINFLMIISDEINDNVYINLLCFFINFTFLIPVLSKTFIQINWLVSLIIIYFLLIIINKNRNYENG